MINSIRAACVAVLACAATLFLSGAVAAPVVYEGHLFPGVTATGTVPTGDGWLNNQGSEVDFWEFGAIAGDVVTVRVHPLDPDFDPAFSIYLGMTSADTAGFDNVGNWGGLTFVDFGATINGAGEDAEWTFISGAFSRYTVAVGGFLSLDNGPFAYEITVTGNTPEPTTLALFGIGIAGLGFARRRTSNKQRQAL